MQRACLKASLITFPCDIVEDEVGVILANVIDQAIMCQHAIEN
jgi:hypothetical protein